ncbi:MAG: TonB-dependent receptor [Gammaproteobacteria bacterium]|nr:TonB-dependent receptor [Gammaproteobacteria bacterium]
MDRESVSQSENPQSVASVFDWFIQFNVFARGDLTPIEVAPGFFIPLLFLDPTSEFNMMAAEGWIFSAFDACSLTCVSNQNAFNNNSTARSERTVFEARLLSKDDGAFRWTAGAFYKQSDDFRQDRQPFLMFPFLDNATLTQSVYADFYADPSNVHLDDFEELSFYGEASYAFNDQWEVTVGARYTDMEQALEESTTATEDQVVSPKLGLAWRPIEGTLVYFNYTTGFRPGNLNLGQEFNARQLAGAGDTVIPATPLTANPLMLTGNEAAALATSRITYDGDTVDNYELGIKTRLWDNRINLTASIYYFDWEDTILAFQETNLPTINQQYNDNAGAAHTQGIELEVVARLTDRFTVRVGGDFNESELDDDFGAVPSGTDLPYAPEWSAALTLDYAIPLGGGWEGKATLNQTWLAKQTRSLNETLTLPQRRQTDLRFSLGDPSNRWLATLFVTNLTDEDKVVIDGTSALFGTNVFVFQAPRMIGLEVTYDFAAQ